MLLPLNLQQWIEENRHLLKPPIGNKLVFPGGDMMVMVVGGPNARTDYHYNPTPEFFYQLEGIAEVDLQVDGKKQTVRIGPGDIFLCPAKVPHRPKRSANTVGLVLEQLRPTGETDGLLWFCESCNAPLYSEFFELTDITKQFQSVFERYFGSTELRTCKACGEVAPTPAELQA